MKSKVTIALVVVMGVFLLGMVGMALADDSNYYGRGYGYRMAADGNWPANCPRYGQSSDENSWNYGRNYNYGNGRGGGRGYYGSGYQRGGGWFCGGGGWNGWGRGR